MGQRFDNVPGLAGYAVRGGKLALNVKVYRGATAEELASVAEERGVSDAARAADPDTGERVTWPAYYARLAESSRKGAELFRDLERFALESAFDHAEEYAAELLGSGVKLWTEGRSGGWLVLAGTAPDAESVWNATERALAERLADDGHEDGAHGDPHDAAEARELLAALGTFRDYVAGVVADFPRAVAWQVCANGFESAAEELEREEKREASEGRLAKATVALRREAEDALPWIESHEEDGRKAARELRAVLAEYDAARTALEDAGGES